MTEAADQCAPLPVQMDPTVYAELFRKRSQPAKPIAGVCGRVMRGRRGSSSFDRLSFQNGRRLAWVTGPAGLLRFLNMSDTEIVIGGIGKSRTWLDEKLREGMGWKLAIVPQTGGELANWDGVFSMIRGHYPERIATKLLRWKSELADGALATKIEARLVTGEIKDNPSHPLHMSEETYLACEDTAVNARLFLWHSLGVSEQFTGTGYTTGGADEYLVPNQTFADMSSYTLIELHVD